MLMPRPLKSSVVLSGSIGCSEHSSVEVLSQFAFLSNVFVLSVEEVTSRSGVRCESQIYVASCDVSGWRASSAL